MRRRSAMLAAVFVACAAGMQPSHAQTGAVERIKVHGKSLEGNLAGDPANRDVSVYLPPSYQTEKNRRYPVLYLLHGFTDSDDKWFGFTKHWINVVDVIDKSLRNGGKEMIVVMPNAYNRFAGSMYSSSITIGNWEEFVARDLVSHIDSRYRTIPSRASRGLAGHSMGGFGTLRLGMKYPETFSAIYAMNPCCLEANIPSPAMAAEWSAKAESIRTDEDFAKAPFGLKAALASGAAWSPNPKNPPFYLDLPTKNGQTQPEIAAKWAANAPLSTIDQYIFALNRMRAIGFDAGTQEGGITSTSRKLHEVLDRYGIAHTFEIYEGNHTNRVAERIETKVMPFFSVNLEFRSQK